MPRTANPFRVARCRELGAEVELVDDVHPAFARVKQIEAEEGRTFVHPFEGPLTALGTATLGLELVEQVPGPRGGDRAHRRRRAVRGRGGGGEAGAARSACVFGVEPEGADSMRRSFDAGSPQAIDAVRTIADSLGAPHAAPYSFALCRRYVDDVVLVDDDALRRAMLLLFSSAKLAVEPAGAAATAALLGPLRERLAGRRVALVVCGANIDAATFSRHLADASAATPPPVRQALECPPSCPPWRRPTGEGPRRYTRAPALVKRQPRDRAALGARAARAGPHRGRAAGLPRRGLRHAGRAARAQERGRGGALPRAQPARPAGGRAHRHRPLRRRPQRGRRRALARPRQPGRDPPAGGARPAARARARARRA